jgi:hypothetical protein
VAFDVFDEVAGGVGLGVRRVGGEDRPFQVQAVQQRPGLPDLVGFASMPRWAVTARERWTSAANR